MPVNNHDPVVIITGHEMFTQIQGLVVGQARTEGKIDTLVTSLNEVKADSNSRLRILEAKSWPLPALAALCGVGGMVAGLWSMLGR